MPRMSEHFGTLSTYPQLPPQPVENFAGCAMHEMRYVVAHPPRHILALYKYCAYSCEHLHNHYLLQDCNDVLLDASMSHPTDTLPLWLK